MQREPLGKIAINGARGWKRGLRRFFSFVVMPAPVTALKITTGYSFSGQSGSTNIYLLEIQTGCSP